MPLLQALLTEYDAHSFAPLALARETLLLLPNFMPAVRTGLFDLGTGEALALVERLPLVTRAADFDDATSTPTVGVYLGLLVGLSGA